MKKIKLLFTILIIVLVSENGFSIDTISTKYYPLKVGNSWTYVKMQYGYPSYTHRVKYTITGTVVTNGHLYYIMGSSQVRIDSTYGRLLTSTTGGCGWLNNEFLLDSLQARLTDSCRSECWSQFETRCTDTNNLICFGVSRKSKTFTYDEHFELMKIRKYVYNIGQTYFFMQMGGPNYYWDTLRGCVINGVLYGDTSLTGINPISTEIPDKFSLSQNYPNPFNPTTKIRFSISNIQYVTLKVFDILGNEVSTLVNEQLKPGTYEVEFNGDNFASGVYYYTLQSESFNLTKRMVLIK
jgi:hypothetical protein